MHPVTGNYYYHFARMDCIDGTRLQEKKIVNGLTIKGKEQVLLKVTVAEVQRNIIKQLGIDLNGSSLSIGSNVINFNTVNAFSTTNGTTVRGKVGYRGGASIDPSSDWSHSFLAFGEVETQASEKVSLYANVEADWRCRRQRRPR